MKKLNLDFIGEIVSSPAGMCSWGGSSISFYGKFKEGNYEYKNDKFKKENLVEAIPISYREPNSKPPKGYYRCTALQVIPEKYLFIEDE